MALTILGVHYRDTKNIGDRYCHPLDYFNYEKSMDDVTLKCDVRNIPSDINPEVVVIGGGAIARHCLEVKEMFPEAIHIAWGIGITRKDHTEVNSATHQKFSRGYELYGCRDYRAQEEYIPCPSCMHPIFDKKIEKTRDVVVYGHAGKMPLAEPASKLGLPYMENNDRSGFEGAIKFMGSARTVVTSSYHGAYWAALLGAKVAVIPFGSKFYSLRNVPPLIDSVEVGIEEAVSFPSSLLEARGISQNFAKRVGELIKPFQRR